MSPFQGRPDVYARRGDVQRVAKTRRDKDIPCSAEISRSGNGAHLWGFFSESIEAARTRTLGSAVLTLAMKEHARLSFIVDRMFPNQDTAPKGGFGNLIALPLQVAASRHGGSLFIDEQTQPYGDQWVYLSSVRKLSRKQVDDLLAQLHTSPLGTLRPDDDEISAKPWRRHGEVISSEDTPLTVTVMPADRLYVPVAGFSNRAQNHLKRIAAFRNPQYCRKQAMRMPVWNIPRVICCAEYQGDYLTLPRGCYDDVVDWMQQHHVHMAVHNEYAEGRNIDVSINGMLREEQEAAFEAMSAHDRTILQSDHAG